MKKKTIACDKCGARIDHIPEKCPECGEIIYDRMEPHVREEIEKCLHKSSIAKQWKIRLLLIIAAIFLSALSLLWVRQSQYSYSTKLHGFPFPIYDKSITHWDGLTGSGSWHEYDFKLFGLIGDIIFYYVLLVLVLYVIRFFKWIFTKGLKHG